MSCTCAPSTGTRIEETARLADQIEASIRSKIPGREVNNILDNLGLPYSPYNTMHLTSGVIGAEDGDILVSLNEKHHPTANYVRQLRRELPREFPGTEFYFLPADITTQILNFGLPAPIDIQLQSDDVEASTRQATAMLDELRQVPGLTDLRIQQPMDYPTLNVNVDRTKAEQGGYTTRDVAQSMLNSLSGSFQITPMFFLNYKNGVAYNLAAQTPQYHMNTLQDIQNIPVSSSLAAPRATPEVLGDLTSIERGHEMAVVSHYNIRRVIDIYGAVQDRDLGAVGKDCGSDRSSPSKTSCPAACSFPCAARCRPCVAPTSPCWAAWSLPSCWSICSSWSTSNRGLTRSSSSPRCRPRWPASCCFSFSPTPR